MDITLYAEAIDYQSLQSVFGDRLRLNEALARYTAARIGGPADALLQVDSAEDLAAAATHLWEMGLPFIILGGGSNILVSDLGVRGVVILNRARGFRFEQESEPPSVWAESGVNFGALARQAGARGLSGLEWAAGIPGTVGGAVAGNAGAHGGDVSGSLMVAEILHLLCVDRPAGKQVCREIWPVEKLEFGYRTSVIKGRRRDEPSKKPSGIEQGLIVLSAQFRLERSKVEAIQARMDDFVAYRHKTQPPGASMGSMFKNPPGDYAGRLVEAAGLKGTRIGNVEISPLHGNFFVNRGDATAMDVLRLIELAREKVAGQFGVGLELEVELVGEWEAGSER